MGHPKIALTNKVEGGHPNVNDTTKPNLVNLSAKGGGL